MYAINPLDGSILWENPDAPLPDVASPVAFDPYLFVCNTNGEMALYQADTGQELWNLEQDEGWYSSPLILDGLVYLFDRKGNSLVIEPKAEGPEILARNSLGESVLATPARSNNRLIVRGKSQLYCLGETP
jgi:outer membrane protein assembly factor BamB